MKKLIYLSLASFMLSSCEKQTINSVSTNDSSDTKSDVHFVNYDPTNPNDEVEFMLKSAGINNKSNLTINIIDGVFVPQTIGFEKISCFSLSAVCAIEVIEEVGTNSIGTIITQDPERIEVSVISPARFTGEVFEDEVEGELLISYPFERF